MPSDVLSKLLSDYKRVEAIASVQLDGWDPRTRPAQETAKREAKDEMERLRKVYTETLTKGLFRVFAVGDGGAEFAAAAAAEGGLVMDVSGFYKEIADTVFATMDHRNPIFTVGVSIRIIEEVNKKIREIGVSRMSTPKWESGDFDIPVPNAYFLKLLVTKGIRAAVEDDIAKVYLEKKIVDTAFKTGIDAKIIPLILFNLGAAEAANLSKTMFSNAPSLTLTDLKEKPYKETITEIREQILNVFNLK
jgi:hypothetical protein